MNVGGYRFFRMPYAFVIDIPHTHPYDELKKNSSSLVDEDHATELSANETPLVPSAANQQAFLPTDVATSPNDVAPNQAQQTNGNGEANATAAAANQAAAPAGNLTTNLAALSHELPGNGSANGTLDTDSTATPQPAPQSQSVSSNQLPPVVASPPANENTPGLTRHRRQQPLHMLVNDSPQVLHLAVSRSHPVAVPVSGTITQAVHKSNVHRFVFDQYHPILPLFHYRVDVCYQSFHY
jgi:hypothetical protein